MAPDFKQLSHAFKGADPDEHRVSRVLMVGGLHDKFNYLSHNDSSILRHVLRVLELWQIPISENLKDFAEHKAKPDRQSVRIINILPEQGGEDFLASAERGELVILANIARDVDDAAILRTGNYDYVNLPNTLRASFTSSPKHKDIKSWHDQIERTGANFVMITNSDGFELDEMNNGNFVRISLPSSGASDDKNHGLLVRKSYLSNIENYLTLSAVAGKSSPLLTIAAAAEFYPRDHFSYSMTSGKILQFGGPGQP